MYNNGQSRRRFHQIATLLLASFAFAILFIAGKLVGLPSDSPKKLANRAANMAAAQCTTALKSAGMAYVLEGDVVSIAESGVRPLSGWAERGSLAVQSCPGYRIKAFCAGSRCDQGEGMHLVMERRR